MTAVPAEKAGSASAINQMTRQLGQALGIALTGSIAASGYRGGFHVQAAGLSDGAAEQAGTSITGALEVARSVSGAVRLAVLDAAHEAFLHGVRIALVVAACLAVAGAIYAARAIPASTGMHLDTNELDELEEATDLIVDT